MLEVLAMYTTIWTAIIVTIWIVLDRADKDNDFVANLFYYGSGALDEYNLTSAEKLAILTGDIKWLEKNIGELNPNHKRWLEQRLSAEIW